MVSIFFHILQLVSMFIFGYGSLPLNANSKGNSTTPEFDFKPTAKIVEIVMPILCVLVLVVLFIWVFCFRKDDRDCFSILCKKEKTEENIRQVELS